MKWKPDTLWWIITGTCNLKCKHCYIEAPQNRYGQVSTAQALLIIDKVINAGIKTFFITGGEPFLRKDILQLFEYIYAKGGKISGLDSNGTIMNNAIISFLKKHDIFINISHDGISFTDDNRGVKIEKKVYKTIKKLTESGVKTNINTTLIPQSLNQIPALFDILKELKIHQWLLFSPFNTGNYIENYRMLKPEEELYVYEKIYNKWKNAGKPFHIRLGNTFDSTRPDTKWERYICEYFRNTITLFPDGQITPCCKYIVHKDYDIFPNIFKHSMSEIFEHRLLQFYKNDKMINVFDLNPECVSCDLLDKCNAGCPMESYLVDEKPYSKDARNCELMKKSHKKFES